MAEARGTAEDRPTGGAGRASHPEAVAAAAVVHPAPAEVDARAAAFFDLDNTVLRGASAFYLARGLYRRRFFRLRDIVSLTWHQTRFLAVGENLDQVAQMRERALVFVRGHRVDELCGIAEEVYDEGIAERIWPGAMALAQAHLDAHQRVWLASATPVEMADVIARRLGLSGALGTVAEHVDGVYTGRLVGTTLHGADKAAAVEALALREGLDLARCAAYSDSANDIPLLELVGDPCAVNPDARLRAHAVAHGWRVRDYRRAHKVARIGLPTLSGVLSGAAGALVAAAVHRRRR
ncbi:MAG TPA: HAD-IB family hydrolase [Actinomycetales bacterium]|jgi:HAD superfamily hydrolase (TIGR01490 family)